MSPMKTHLLLVVLLQTHLWITSGFTDSGINLLENGEIGGLVSRVGGEEEFEMDTEVSRRMLIAQRKYISYETLKRDGVPCSLPGASYYNCGSTQANPYSRGCDIITRCAKNIRQ